MRLQKRRVTVALSFLPLLSNVYAYQGPEAAIDRSQIEVVVLGTHHLTDHDFNKIPIDTGAVRRRVAQFQPDHVAVEWLHPSVDPKTTHNYPPLGDFETLKNLWGHTQKDVSAELERMRELLARPKSRNLPQAEARVELGKLYYLNSDALNAGYQWWVAKKLGADVGDVQRLTSDNFEGHELEVYGFPIAHQQGLEYLTPFDYQGADAEWDEVEMRIFSLVRAAAIQAKYGVAADEKDPRWKKLAEEFDASARAWYENDDPKWKNEYAGIKAVDEIIAWAEDKKKGYGRTFDTADGLALMRYLSSDEFIARERHGYYDLIAGVSVEGLGEVLVKNYELRNSKMIDFIEQDIPKLKSKRILIIVGSGHRLFLEDQLRGRGYKVTPALRFLR